LEPGERVLIEKLPPLDLKWQLTKRRLEKSDDITKPWDQTDFDDLRRIIEVMLLHGAAGGSSYTRLAHRYQGYVDLSEHLITGRAALIGWSDQMIGRFVADGAELEGKSDRSLAVYRVVFPVSTGESDNSLANK
jgi:hypothetical protein